MTIERSLEKFAKRLRSTKSLQSKPIVLRLNGKEGGDFFFDCSKGDVKIAKGQPSDIPVVELIGDAQKIAAVLEGRKSATEQFLTGGFRIRGDLRYVSDVAIELGLIEEPL